MKTSKRIQAAGCAVVVAAASLMLAGCGEKSQDLAAAKTGRYQGKPDSQPWDNDPGTFAAGNFTKGDRAGWEKALATRAQAQNEYGRAQ